MKNRISELFKIEYPIIQAGMVWCSGWKLASSVSNAGGLGLIGSGSMHPEVLREHIQKCKKATHQTFGVNVPLIYPYVEDHMNVILEEKVKVVFTSAGNPKNWTTQLKSEGITVVHVVSSIRFAIKSVEAGVDAVVAEGFEAGGHNGREETTTLCLIPMVRDAIDIPLIAAGGIGSGRAMLAVMTLGAEGVQIGSRFAISLESSAHDNFKRKILEAGEGDTQLTLKKLTPVRMIKNRFFEQIKMAEDQGAEKNELIEILGRGRAKTGIFMGNLEEGELEIGQVSAMIKQIKSSSDILKEIWQEFIGARELICQSASSSEK
jgi:enoyl-[acyl-carrier protein] reductase II